MKKFSYIIGNPPYQVDRVGTSNTAQPIYHTFMDGVNSIGNVVELVTPARFLFNAGLTPKSWNEKMLSDPHFKVLEYFPNSQQVFPNAEIKGGVAITYHDANRTVGPIGIFTPFPFLNSILAKITPRLSSEGAIERLGFVASKFNLDNLVMDYPDLAGRERRMSTNVLALSCFHDNKDKEDIAIFGLVATEKGKIRDQKYIRAKYVDHSDPRFGKYKIVLAKADGNGNFGETLTRPQILSPGVGFTHSFLGLGEFSTSEEANAALKYIKTKFARALLGSVKITQDVNAQKWRFVPLQAFTSDSDIDWSQSIADIDQQLYRKYGLSNEEIEFIETNVKEMA